MSTTSGDTSKTDDVHPREHCTYQHFLESPQYNVMLLVAGSGYGMAVHCEQIWMVWLKKTEHKNSHLNGPYALSMDIAQICCFSLLSSRVFRHTCELQWDFERLGTKTDMLQSLHWFVVCIHYRKTNMHYAAMPLGISFLFFCFKIFKSFLPQKHNKRSTLFTSGNFTQAIYT